MGMPKIPIFTYSPYYAKAQEERSKVKEAIPPVRCILGSRGK
jgi:hypothetical protein